MALLFGEKPAAIGDDQTEVASAGLIDAGKIDLIENAVAEREPVQRGSIPGQPGA